MLEYHITTNTQSAYMVKITTVGMETLYYTFGSILKIKG
jgi:hypothetical protein